MAGILFRLAGLVGLVAWGGCSGSSTGTRAPEASVATPGRGDSSGLPDATPGAPDCPAPVSSPRPRLLWKQTGIKVADHVDEPLRAAGSGLVSIELEKGVFRFFDARTGKPSAATTAPKPPPRRVWDESYKFSEPVVVGDEEYVLTPAEVVRRDARSRRVLQHYPLPACLAHAIEARQMTLVADRGRFALVELAPSLEGVIVTASNPSGALVPLDRPTLMTSEHLLVGSVLLSFEVFGGGLSAYDLALEEPPLASLPPDQAVAAVQKDMAGQGSLVCRRLALLPTLGPYLVELLEKPGDSLWGCALSLLTQRPEPGAGPVLRRLAERPPSSGDVDFGRPLDSILRALAATDDFETSRLLVDFAKHPERGGGEWVPGDRLRLAHVQLWRTGRISDLGFCPKVERTRNVPELARKAPNGSIGTKHPLLFQDVAGDGSWTLVCQARNDDDRDGKIEVHLGQDGGTYGDDMAPYLVVGSGPGWPIEDAVSADPTGRYVAVREGACLSLVDTRSASAVTLPNVDLRDSGVLDRPRGAAFDAAGKRMLYLRGGPTPAVVVRELSTGRETSLNPGPGLIWSAMFDESESALELEVIPSGRWPAFGATILPRGCRGAPLSYSVFGEEGFRSVIRLVPLDGSPLRELGDANSRGRQPRLRSGPVRPVDDDERELQGEYAERQDGSVLALDVKVAKGRAHDTIPLGPLRWRPPARRAAP